MLRFVSFCALPHNSGIRKKQTTRAAPARGTSAQATDVRLSRIVRLLTNHAMVVVSGTKIAAELGTSRSEVWRLIKELRASGAEIAGHPATGYTLQSVPDLLLPDILAPLLKGTIFAGKVHHYFKAGSTNALAMEAAASGAPEGTVFIAEEQTAGRGRGGNKWHSPRSTGIYCSVVLRPQAPPSDVLPLSLAAGIAVHDAVKEVMILSPDMKWPNDVLFGDKKFCGILTEMNAEPTRVRHVVIGMGVNVNQTSFPESVRDVAVSLSMVSGSIVSRVELLAALLKSLDREYRALFAPNGRESVLRRFEERSSWTRGRAVRIENHEKFEGVTEGLDAQGFLKVRVGSVVWTVLSGSVRAAE